MAAPALAQGTRRVREAATLAQVVGQYVKLRPSGIGRLSGLCPFHQEKSPSFTVSTVKNLYMCFGCGAGGDVLTFVQKIEGVSFMEARSILAEQYGISLDDRPLTRAEQALQKRQRAYAEQLAADTSLYWQEARRRYQSRFDTLMRMAIGCSDRGWETEYQHYARRAWRWGAIIRRLDAREPAWIRRQFERVRSRYPVVKMIARMHTAERATDETWAQIIAAARAGKVSEEQVMRVTEAVYAHPERRLNADHRNSDPAPGHDPDPGCFIAPLGPEVIHR